MPTEAEIKAGTKLVVAVAAAIRDLGEVPSGHLYAHLMGQISLEQYNSILRVMEKLKWITVKHYLITWIGPAKPTTETLEPITQG